MSERVSDKILRMYRGIEYADSVRAIADELLDLRPKLEAWEALGESPEAVRAELDRLRTIASGPCPSPSVQSGLAGGGIKPTRPTFAEALGREAREMADAAWKDAASSSATADMATAKAITALRDMIHRARRASGE